MKRLSVPRDPGEATDKVNAKPKVLRTKVSKTLTFYACRLPHDGLDEALQLFLYALAHHQHILVRQRRRVETRTDEHLTF